MKFQGHNNNLDTNVVENETQDFSIGDPSVIIDILRNRLYEHKIQTTCQEYICNARDAMREVGKANGFEVTVPARLNPVFKVRDFGPGITPDRMANVFIKYGASTKRGTNGQTGGFGIGAKSAWSYTDSFTVVTFVDGLKRSYVAHIGVNNQGRLDLVSTDKTDEANGTEIQVAVKAHDIQEFRNAIFRAIYHWEEKPTLKGELSPPILVKGEVISELLEITNRDMMPEYCRPDGYSDMVAVIDGIPYSIGHALVDKVPALQELKQMVRKNVILHFGNGIVEVSASRESIADSKPTVAALQKLARKAVLELQTHIKGAFAKATTTAEYLNTYANLSKDMNVDEFAKYDDYSMEGSRLTSELFEKVKMTYIHCMGRYGRAKVDKITKSEYQTKHKRLSLDYLPHMFYVSTDESPVIQNKRIREYFKVHSHMVLVELQTSVVQTLDANKKPVLDAENKPTFHSVTYTKEFKKVIADLGAKDFSTLTYVDPPKVKKAKVKREDTEICLHNAYGPRHSYTTVATNTKKRIYVTLEGGSYPAKYSLQTMRNLQDFLSEEKISVCAISEHAAKMVKGDPTFLSIEDYLNNFKPSKDAIVAAKAKAAQNSHSMFNVSHLPLKEIEDTFLVEMAEEYSAMTKAKSTYMPDILVTEMDKVKEVAEFKQNDLKLKVLIKKEYPLVDELGQYSGHKKELVFYINAKFKARKGK